MKRVLIFILIISMMGAALMSCSAPVVSGPDETNNGSDIVTQVPSESLSDTVTQDTSIVTQAPTDATVSDTTEAPTDLPTEAPTDLPTEVPTEAPTVEITDTEPVITPPESDTTANIESETVAPTEKPTEPATEKPTEPATEKPTFNVKESTSGLKFELNPDGLSYTLVDMGTASNKAEIVIDGYKGLPVTKIGYGVFDNSIKKNTVLTKVTIGNYVEEIGFYAFSHCSKLTSVTMGSGVKVIGLGAFRYCSKLTSIKLGSNVERIEDSAFYKSTALSSITIPDTVRHIGEYAFDQTAYYNDSSKWVKNALYIGNHLIMLKSSSSGTLNVKDGTKCIADVAIANCKSITKVVIPNSVVVIGAKAFKNCTALATLELGTGITFIGEDAFYNTKFYNTSGNWSSNILYAGSYLLAAKPALSGGVNVKSGTKAIASTAFESCNKVTSVTLPASVVAIGEYAFVNCTGITSVTIGKNIKTIYPNAFKGCVKLTGITLPEYTGWKVDGVRVTESELQTKSDAAILLTSLYLESRWTR